MQRVRILIEGRVQGVAFRYHTCTRARALGLTGWVRNCADGRVEAEFEGPEPVVDEMLAWCQKGPASARVSNVSVASRTPADVAHCSDFRIRP